MIKYQVFDSFNLKLREVKLKSGEEFDNACVNNLHIIHGSDTCTCGRYNLQDAVNNVSKEKIKGELKFQFKPFEKSDKKKKK